jgi:uroporphyrinogen-III synthase
MKVIITRPSPDAESLAAEVGRLGAEPILSPVMAIRRRDAPLDLAGVGALAFTSLNGVRAFASLSADRDLDVFAVGPATASGAAGLGFDRVLAADGDVESLAALIAKAKPAGPVLHLAGSDRAGDLIRLLADYGVPARREVIYDAVEIETLSRSAHGVLAGESENPAVVFFSPRSAGLFLKQASRAGLEARLADATALCLSRDVAKLAGDARWKRLLVADARNTEAMLRLIKAMLAERKGRTD